MGNPLFDWKTEQAEARKRDGIRRRELHDADWLDRARRWCAARAERCGRVTADDLRDHVELTGDTPNHPNSYGAVFRDYRFVHIGFETSRQPSRRAGVIRVWGRSKNP